MSHDQPGTRPNKIDGNLLAVASHALDCAEGWEDGARIIGNCRAVDLAAIFREYLSGNAEETESFDTWLRTYTQSDGRGYALPIVRAAFEAGMRVGAEYATNREDV